MFTPFLYFTAMLSIFTARTSAAPKNMAWLYSGEYDTCNLEQWDESLADSEKGRNMDGDSCITGQPTGDGRRRFVWVPYLRAQYYGQKDGVEDYCLVMFEEDKCPREKDCNYKHTLDIRLNSTSESCRELPGAGADDGALNYQSFYFVAGTTCQEYTNGGCNIT